MRKLFFILCLFFFLAPCLKGASLLNEAGRYTLMFDGEELLLEGDRSELDFGNIREGVMAAVIISIENTSDQPLRIANVRGSCGLSVPVWPRQIIEPGSSATIQIRYDSSRPGKINRHLTIHANTTSSVTVLQVSGQVIP